jgi:hypothetical protein
MKTIESGRVGGGINAKNGFPQPQGTQTRQSLISRLSLARPSQHPTPMHHDPYRLYHGTTCSRIFFFFHGLTLSPPSHSFHCIVSGVAPPPTTTSMINRDVSPTARLRGAPYFLFLFLLGVSKLAFKVMARDHDSLTACRRGRLGLKTFSAPVEGG